MALELDIKPIELTDLTESKIDGNGVFDALMRTVNAHLLDQYDHDRISDSSYGEVYLGSMQAAISQSIQFLLSKDKASLDAALIEAQTKKIDSEIALVNVQKELAEIEKRKSEAEIAKINQDILFSQAQQKNLETENQKILSEIKLVDAQVKIAELQEKVIESDLLKAEKEIEKLDAEVTLTIARAAIAEKELIVMDSTILKAQKEVELMDAELARQPIILKKLTAETELVESQVDKIVQEILNLRATEERINAEKRLLEFKQNTEKAQTQDGASGVIGAQISLYAAQRQGFKDDAKVKKTKAANDVYAIAKSNDPTAVADPVNYKSTLEAALSALLSD